MIAIAAIDVTGKTIAPADKTRLRNLSDATQLQIATEGQLPELQFYLYWRDQQLTLKDQSSKNPVDISIDFCSGKNHHRLRFGGGFGQPLARAINVKPQQPQTICDATGGLGQDAFVFASLGCDVVVVEQSKVVAALLDDALSRARKNTDIAPIARRMQIHRFNSCHLPQHWPLKSPPSTVYLDPMYPVSGKSAAAKKGMNTLQKLLPLEHSIHTNNAPQDDESSLLHAALSTATHRVVVKRPAKAPPLGASTPVGSVNSPNTRYDIYKPSTNL